MLTHLFLFFSIYFYQLEANYFTVLQWFLSYIDMNQPWIHMCSPSRSPPPTSLPTSSLWVFPVHQTRALVSCIQPGLVICFTLDNIHVLMLFSQNTLNIRLLVNFRLNEFSPHAFMSHIFKHMQFVIGASQVAQTIKNLPAMQEIQILSLVWEDPLE